MSQGLTKNIPIVTNTSDTSNSDSLVWSQKAINSILSLFKSNNFIDATSSIQTQLNSKEKEFVFSNFQLIKPINGNATMNNPISLGTAAPSMSGGTARVNAITNYFTTQPRIGVQTAATVGSTAYYTKGGTTDGIITNFPFYQAIRFGKQTTTLSSRMFIGLIGSVFTPSNMEPNTQTNCLGICELSTSNNLQIITNDGVGTATTIDLGTGFPINTASTDTYVAEFFNNVTTIDYKVTRISATGVYTTTSGTLTTDLPAQSTLLMMRGYCSTTTANITAFDLMLHQLTF